MGTIWIGDEEFIVGDLKAEIRFECICLRAEINGLQEFLVTRQDILDWLDDIQENT